MQATIVEPVMLAFCIWRILQNKLAVVMSNFRDSNLLNIVIASFEVDDKGLGLAWPFISVTKITDHIGVLMCMFQDQDQAFRCQNWG